VPTRWSAAQPELRRHAPRFGEHSAELRRAVGYTDADIARMAESRVTVLA
jgi:crotonobetainyl-CoA:carnitine CoA-transferase CaiB-like acyl-CoA transferase